MVLSRRQMKSGSALFGFFAANDAELSAYLNSLSANERATISSTLDGALQAPSAELFTQSFTDLLHAHFQLQEGTEGELRLRAITRMLGLVLRDKYRRDPTIIWDQVLAETTEASGDMSAEPDIYDRAREQLSQLLRKTNLSDDWVSRSEAAHWAADILAFELIKSGSDDPLCVELRRIRDEEDVAAAMQAVCGLSWNFVFDESIFSALGHDRDEWLKNLRTGLAPMEELGPDRSNCDDLADLHDKFISVANGGNKSAYYFSLTRWILKHLQLDDAEVLVISAHMTMTAIELKKRFAEAAT